jgi:hypothetical protein
MEPEAVPSGFVTGDELDVLRQSDPDHGGGDLGAQGLEVPGADVRVRPANSISRPAQVPTMDVDFPGCTVLEAVEKQVVGKVEYRPDR